MNTSDPVLDFEQAPSQQGKDETEYSLRAYVARIPEEKLAQYNPAWSNDQVVEWDGNFRSDGALMLVCCERDVGVGDFRTAIEEFIRYRRGSPNG